MLWCRCSCLWYYLCFSAATNSERSYQGDQNALWFFILAILCALCAGFQNYFFAAAAVVLTAKLRSLSFKAILRQDIEYFDNDENRTGTLTSSLSENSQRINGLAGVTLGTIIQCIATLVVGLAIGYAYAWRTAVVGIMYSYPGVQWLYTFASRCSER